MPIKMEFKFYRIPDGSLVWWYSTSGLDLIVDGSAKTVKYRWQTLNLTYSAFTWQTHLWANTLMDLNQNGIQDPGEPGLIQVPAGFGCETASLKQYLLSDSAAKPLR